MVSLTSVNDAYPKERSNTPPEERKEREDGGEGNRGKRKKKTKICG